MPIVVDPGFAWPPEVDPVVSPDGRLTVIVDPAHAGVLLRADFDDSIPDTPAVPEVVHRRNLVANSSFEMDATTVVATRCTVEASGDRAFVGSRSLKVTGTGGGATYLATTETGVVAGVEYTHSLMVWPDTGVGYVNVNINYQDASHAELSNAGTGYQSVTPGEWNMVSFSATAPAGAVEARLIWNLRNESNANPAAGCVAYTDAHYLGPYGPFFDGDTAPSGSKRYRWTGPANASISEEYLPATPFIPGHGATTAKVRFERQDGSVVRSGNPAWAPGGYAHAYDHEATLGGGTLWRAVPIRFDGTEGTPSEYVGAVIPALSDGWAWLKPVADPDKAMLLKVEPPDLSYDGRVDTTSIAGAPRPAATWDVLEGFTTQLRSLVREKNVEEQLKALLDEGPVLAQFPACAGLPDFYFIRGKLDLEHVHWDGWPWRRYQWDVIQIDRPDTTDSPLRIPGLSYDTVERDWTTYDQLKSTVSSYNKLLEP